MTFSDATKRVARQRAGGTCECTLNTCQHFGRCRVRGEEFHHKTQEIDGGEDIPKNCQFLCKNCHTQVHKTSGGLIRL